MDRPLTPDELHLIRWMLEHGSPEAQAFLPQLDKANATPWQWPCGCESVDLSIDGAPEPSGSLRILADFIFGTDADLKQGLGRDNGGDFGPEPFDPTRRL